MRQSIVAAAAAVLAVAAPAGNAVALSAATPDQLERAGIAGGMEKTALICDPWRCYWRPRYWGGDRPDPYWGLRRHYWWGGHQVWGWRRW
jgi:hypothetical protein